MLRGLERKCTAESNSGGAVSPPKFIIALKSPTLMCYDMYEIISLKVCEVLLVFRFTLLLAFGKWLSSNLFNFYQRICSQCWC